MSVLNELLNKWLKMTLPPVQSGFLECSPSTEVGDFFSYYQLDSIAGTGRLAYWHHQSWRLVLHVWMPDRIEPLGTLILCHGLFDHMAIYRPMVQLALDLGYCVVGVDLPGHGLSSGERGRIDDFADYQRILLGLYDHLARLQMPVPWHGLGQSTGGGILWSHLLEHPDSPLKEIMLLAPLVRPASFRQVQWSYRAFGSWVNATPRTFRVNSADSEFIQFTHYRDPLQPRQMSMAWVRAMLDWEHRWRNSPKKCLRRIQIVQGGRDQTVDWTYNLVFLHRHFPAARILFVEHASHHLANEAVHLRQPVEFRLRYMLESSHQKRPPE